MRCVFLVTIEENEKLDEQRGKNELQKQSSLKNSKINEKRASNALNAFRKYAKHVMTAGEFLQQNTTNFLLIIRIGVKSFLPICY